MKLKDILPYIDMLSNTRIFVLEDFEKDEIAEPAFEGSVIDIPWIYLNHTLVTPEENGGSEAICPYYLNEHSGIRFTVKEH